MNVTVNGIEFDVIREKGEDGLAEDSARCSRCGCWYAARPSVLSAHAMHEHEAAVAAAEHYIKAEGLLARIVNPR